ncbi:MAG TPA: (Fe-S)-binding protein [Geobacteraceae bacterium]
MTPHPFIFAPILLIAVFLFCHSCYERLRLVAIGTAENRFDRPAERLKAVLSGAFGQKRVVGRTFGLNHLVIFWSFLILLVANGEFLLHGLFPGVSLALLPAPIHHGLLALFDCVSLLVLVSVTVAAARRAVAPPFPEARTVEAFAILALIALLMLASFGLHGAEVALGNEPEAHLPVSGLVARLLLAAPLALSLQSSALFFWWLHAGLLLVFLNYLPRSKHMHILTAIPNCYLRSLDRPVILPREEFRPGTRLGTGEVSEFTWKDLYDGFSCTECGRCQEVCPAALSGKPLSPRRVVYDIKTNLLANSARLRQGKDCQVPLVGKGVGSIASQAIWSCTTCGACLEVCPVYIEQMPKIARMRRHLVQMESSFPEELLNLFENMEQRANPWGIAPGERSKWSTTLDVRPFAAGETEYLLFVGCAGAFDARQKQVTVALATILDAAGVSWGVLGKEERCCGDSLRRLGNEYVFDRLARENVGLFADKRVTKVITACPHCFSTLKNDYFQYGLAAEVIHHSELIDSLLRAGKLRLHRQADDLGRIVFHDSCYLGRHNDVYDQPRRAIAAATGNAAVELERSRAASFCCGAGGGRMWMEEHEGSRINHDRVAEALKLQPDTLCVSCPFCMTMFEDGLKDLHAEAVRVRDIAEVVAEALRT